MRCKTSINWPFFHYFLKKGIFRQVTVSRTKSKIPVTPTFLTFKSKVNIRLSNIVGSGRRAEKMCLKTGVFITDPYKRHILGILVFLTISDKVINLELSRKLFDTPPKQI